MPFCFCCLRIDIFLSTETFVQCTMLEHCSFEKHRLVMAMDPFRGNLPKMNQRPCSTKHYNALFHIVEQHFRRKTQNLRIFCFVQPYSSVHGTLQNHFAKAKQLTRTTIEPIYCYNVTYFPVRQNATA